MEEGWKRRMVASEPRLSEIVEMYKSLGFEVKLVPLDPSDPEAERTKVVYTRPKPGKGPDEDEGLFD